MNMSDYTSRALSTKQQILATSGHSPSSSENRPIDHSEMVEHVFGNLSILRKVLESDKALSNMLHDMIEAAKSVRPCKSPAKIRPLPAPNPPTNRRPRWGDED